MTEKKNHLAIIFGICSRLIMGFFAFAGKCLCFVFQSLMSVLLFAVPEVFFFV